MLMKGNSMDKLMEQFPAIDREFDKLTMLVTQTKNKTTDQNQIEYLNWLESKLESILIEESRFDD